MYCRVYNEHSEELSQGGAEELLEVEEEDPQEVEQDLQEEEHQHHLPTFPSNQHNPLKMSR